MLLIDLVREGKSWGELSVRLEPLRVYRRGELQFSYSDRVTYHNLCTAAEVRAYNKLLTWLGSDDVSLSWTPTAPVLYPNADGKYQLESTMQTNLPPTVS